VSTNASDAEHPPGFNAAAQRNCTPADNPTGAEGGIGIPKEASPSGPATTGTASTKIAGSTAIQMFAPQALIGEASGMRLKPKTPAAPGNAPLQVTAKLRLPRRGIEFTQIAGKSPFEPEVGAP
jgi:hypothetical protein